MNVIRLDDARPHFRMTGADGNQHVLPVALVVNVATGRMSPDALGDECLVSIVREWLNGFGLCWEE